VDARERERLVPRRMERSNRKGNLHKQFAGTAANKPIRQQQVRNHDLLMQRVKVLNLDTVEPCRTRYKQWSMPMHASPDYSVRETERRHLSDKALAAAKAGHLGETPGGLGRPLPVHKR
jgi:hypothetical protein